MTGRRRHEALSELGIFAVAYVVYFGVRALTEGTAAAAMQHAFDLVELEQRLGIAWEQAVQNAVVGSGILLDAANAVYIYGHWPVIIVGGILLFRYRRRHYYSPAQRGAAQRPRRASSSSRSSQWLRRGSRTCRWSTP